MSLTIPQIKICPRVHPLFKLIVQLILLILRGSERGKKGKRDKSTVVILFDLSGSNQTSNYYSIPMRLLTLCSILLLSQALLRESYCLENLILILTLILIFHKLYEFINLCTIALVSLFYFILIILTKQSYLQHPETDEQIVLPTQYRGIEKNLN